MTCRMVILLSSDFGKEDTTGQTETILVRNINLISLRRYSVHLGSCQRLSAAASIKSFSLDGEAMGYRGAALPDPASTRRSAVCRIPEPATTGARR